MRCGKDYTTQTSRALRQSSDSSCPRFEINVFITLRHQQTKIFTVLLPDSTGSEVYLPAGKQTKAYTVYSPFLYVKITLTLEKTTMAQRGSRGIALLFL